MRKRLDGAMLAYMQRLAKYVLGSTQQRSGTFFILFSCMARAIAMPRAFGDKDTRDQVLALARDYYFRTFAGAGSATAPE